MTTGQKTRIGLLITELRVGGAERCLTNLARGLDRRKFEPLVCSLGPEPTGEQGLLVDQLREAGVPVNFLGVSRWGQFLTARREARRWLQDERIDLLQTFLFHANVVGCLAAGRQGPLVVTGVRVADPRRWRGFAERLLTRRAAAIVAVSRSVADFLVRRGGFQAGKVEVIGNGVDFVEPRVPPTDETGRRSIASIGRLDPQKGLDWLLQNARRILDRFPQHDLCLVGDGPQRAELERLVAANGLESRVKLLGWRRDALRFAAAADLFVLPSRWEGMPNALLEAMALGLPVVCTRVEGAEEILGELAEMQTVDFGDDAALFQAVERILGDPEEARRLGEANRQRVEREFSFKAMIGRYEALYQRLLSGDGQG